MDFEEKERKLYYGKVRLLGFGGFGVIRRRFVEVKYERFWERIE